jgi:hypothetical protein
MFGTRQVHLDFHTSEHITHIGAAFSKEQFQQALQVGHVNHINVFAKCHHGWSYYPTEVGNVHPHLDFDLLGAQLEACHEIGVAAPIYYTIGWSVHDAETHPEWCVHDRNGAIRSTNIDPNAQPLDPRPGYSWHFMCPSGGYLDLILAQTEEICRRYPVDGFWYDITDGPNCFCDTCMAGMRAEGVDIDDFAQVCAYHLRTWSNMMSQCNQIIHRFHPDARVYYNGTTKLYPDGVRECRESQLYRFNTQQELEDLPTTWGGYDKLPLRSKFFHNLNQDLVAMSGKFHTSWGEFGGFKHPDALRFEAASMMAFGALCNFGDQLHPNGQMDMETYTAIGQAYVYVEAIEAFCINSRPYSKLGLWQTMSEPDDEGINRMLLELQMDYRVVDPDGDLSAYDTIILTGAPGLSREHADKLNAFAQKGGKLLVIGASALNAERDAFLIDIGATYLGPSNYDVDYLVVGDTLGRNLVSSPFLNYEGALRVQPHAQAEVLADIVEPYFSRTYGTYCSHLNTPPQPNTTGHPGAIRNGNIIFLPHALGRIYYQHGARLHRDFFRNALQQLYLQPTVEVDLPSSGRVSVMYQAEHDRYVVHLLYASPIQRGRCLVIEDIVPLHDITLTVRLPQAVQKIYTIPGFENLEPEIVDEAIRVTVPVLNGHQAIVFE